MNKGGDVFALHNHRLRINGSTVVTITGKVDGKMEILTQCWSETPKNIETKIGLNDYAINPYKTASVSTL